jgi:superfamily I DNA/RNA helicase
MERIEVVTRAATALRAHRQAEDGSSAGAERIERLCDELKLELEATAAGGVMLGGAYSRLQLWAWDQPALGGIIWLREDLEPETRLFAIAHELGHYALHRGEGIALHPACDQREVDQRADPGDLRTEDHHVEEYTPRARRELEANIVAAELLAPRADVRHRFTAGLGVDAARVAAHFGISRALAQRRLIDAVLGPTRPLDDASASVSEPASGEAGPPAPLELIERLDDGQRQAARTPGPALVVAGPGTGKTATLVGRVAHLVEERSIPPEKVLALTFSNRAAGEMRDRLARSGLPGERMPIMTIHAFATTLLREYASRVPHGPDEAALKPDFRILDEADAFLLMEELLGVLPLHYYRSLGKPTARLRTLLADFSQARDGLLTPAEYLALVDAMPLAPAAQEESGAEPTDNRTNKAKAQSGRLRPPAGTFTAEQIAKARERALAYGVWDRELRRRGLVDFGGLIQRAVELLRDDPDVLADVRGRYPELLVDEFQDTNRAAAELLMLVAGPSGSGLWVVGDRNQSIYRFRGASPGNLPRLVAQYPRLCVLTLRRCYRSVPAIVRLGSVMAERMAEHMAGLGADKTDVGETAPIGATDSASVSVLHEVLRPLALEPVRGNGAHPAIRRGEAFASAAHERLGLAAAIEQHRALGYTYGDQAVLCRKNKQAREIAAALASQDVPVSQLGDFFDRSEVKDALMLVTLAAGPDARGVLRATPFLIALGYTPPAAGELAAAARALASRREALPWALRRKSALDSVAPLSAATRAALDALGEVAIQLRNGQGVGAGLADFLLRPGGYAWRLARIADGLDGPQPGEPPVDGRTEWAPEAVSPAQAQQALAALGELVRLAWRFDTRWSREPDFRARLSRAVSHRRAMQPAAPDALESAPVADVARSAFPTAQLEVADASLDATASPTAPSARCFLHYLDALRAADTTVPVPAGEEDAVHVLTLHQSKGLEFPVVYLPGLAQGQFPAGMTARDEVCPPSFRESDAPGEDEAEERCLFYVGMTRARDVVAFTRAASYSRAAGGAARTAQPSSLLALVDGVSAGTQAVSLLPDAELERLAAAVATSSMIGGGDDDEDPEGAAAVTRTHENEHAASEKPLYQLRELLQYIDCPQQYKYARSYGLLDPVEDAVHRFHRFIRRGAQALRDVQATTPDADWQATTAHLRELWETDGPAGHAYDSFYWQAAEAILREEWTAITSPDSAMASDRVLLAQPLRAELRACVVEVTADRVIEDTIQPVDSAASTELPLTVLVRLHTGRPREDDKNDLALPLYYLAYQQQYPGAPVRIALAYVGGALSDGGETSAEASGPKPGDLVDVTDIALRDVEKYLKPDRKQRSKLDKLDEAALGIAAGRFALRPDDRRCATCAYCYVCPVDPDSAESSMLRVATNAQAVMGASVEASN